MKLKRYLYTIFSARKFRDKGDRQLGFTLTELLVVIVVIGVLAAIAIPSYTNQARKARQTEAILSINACQKKQTAYYIEKSQFTDSLDNLGIKQETENFQYRVEIFPPSNPNDKDTVACCLANEKGSFGQLFVGCISDTSI